MKNLMLASGCLFVVSITIGYLFSSPEVQYDSIKYGLIGLITIAIAGAIPEKTFKVFLALMGALILVLGQVLWPIKAFLG